MLFAHWKSFVPFIFFPLSLSLAACNTADKPSNNDDNNARAKIASYNDTVEACEATAEAIIACAEEMGETDFEEDGEISCDAGAAMCGVPSWRGFAAR